MGLNFTIDMTRGLGLGLGSSTILKVRFFWDTLYIECISLKLCNIMTSLMLLLEQRVKLL